MELRQLRYLEAVARHRSFTRAAAELHTAQSALSHQVRRLEDELGVQLLHRTSRQVAVSAAGEVVLARARRVLAEADDLAAELADLTGVVQGEVALGAVLPAGPLDLPALLVELRRRHPAVWVHLREGTADDMRAWLVADELDLAIAALDPLDPGPGLTATPLFAEELVAVVPEGHQLAGNDVVELEELAADAFVAPSRGSALRARLEEALGAPLAVALETSDLRAIRALVARELGVAVLPQSAVQEPGPRVVTRRLRPVLVLPFALVRRDGRTSPPAAAALAALAVERAAA
jgi:DNA-binding transcriptional LysR family regulator